MPIAKTLGISAIVAYLVAGIAIGPYGLGVFSTAEQVLPFAELGIVMLMFVIGLELEISRLVAMRRDILGLGAAQWLITSAAICGLAFCSASPGAPASSSALRLHCLPPPSRCRSWASAASCSRPTRQRALAILLFQDIAIVPVLALLPLLAPGGETQSRGWVDTLTAIAHRRRRDRGHRHHRPLSAQSVLPPAC